MYKVSIVDVAKFETRKELFFESLNCAKLKIEELEKDSNTGCFLSRVVETVIYTSESIHNRIG